MELNDKEEFMPWKCPSCGRQNYGTFNNCVCGYFSNDVVLTKHAPTSHLRVAEKDERYNDIPSDDTSDDLSSLLKPREDPELPASRRRDSADNPPQEEVIKEIDSWLFSFSSADGCISIGTPALRSFKLKLSLGDLEDLLDFAYQKTGNEKTTRKISLTTTDIVGVIDKVDRMIEEKKSKVFLQFTGDELEEITDFINLQLRV
ncbi:MAG TPA: hypothetical protein VEI96_13090 [Thermodesulfovibrionales bacterium]|nr:hypothetical protein [Thermodesulfovibrionales bacterium]